jgi:competence protein ComEC
VPVALLPFAAVGGLALGILASEAAGPAALRMALAGLAALAALATISAVAGARHIATWMLIGATCMLGASLGIVRGAAAELTTGPGSVAGLIGDEVTIRGTAADDARPREDRQQVVLAGLTKASEPAGPVTGRLLVWLPRGVSIAAGDVVELATTLEEPRDFEGFAYREYLARQGIGAIARSNDAAVTPGAGAVSALAGLRAILRDGLNDVVPEPEAALGSGILLGVRSGIAPEIDDAFADAGLTHVVAISGWNIAIVAAVIGAIAEPIGRRRGGRWLSATVSVAAVGGYVLLTGAGPSVVRAALMAGAMLLVRMGGSRAHAASALCAAAGVMLLVAPPVVWDVGFQLSLLATGGLIWFGAGIEGRLGALPPWLREPIALTIAAQLTTLPVLLVNFERLSLVAPLANVVVVPIVPFAMLACALASLAGTIGDLLPLDPMRDLIGWAFGGAAWLALHLMIAAGTAFASIPASAVGVSVPVPLAIAWYPCLALGWWSMRSAPSTDRSDVRLITGGGHRPTARGVMSIVAAGRAAMRPRFLGVGLIAVLWLTTVPGRSDGRLHLFGLDIGQGDAILIRTADGATMLIDGGPDPELTLRELGQALPWDVHHLDVLMLSHPHQDHVAGLLEIVKRYRIGLMLHAGIPFENPAYPRFLAEAAARRIPVTLARAGQRLALGTETSIEILYPTRADAAAPLPEGDINNGSVVAILRYRSFSALLTGDAEAPIEATLLTRNLIQDVDVLKVGHHGSASSTSGPLLDAAAPEVAIISVGVDNEYGHPAPETLAALAAQPGLTTFRTDTDGRVEVTSDGDSYAVEAESGRSITRRDDGAIPLAADAASIGRWPSLTSTPLVGCWTRRSCLPASWCTQRACGASRSRRRAWWSRPASRSTGAWSRPPLSSTISTRVASAVSAASTGSWARACSAGWDTTSSRSRSPPTRSVACSTTSASRSAGRRSSWRSRTATSRSIS